MILGEGPHIIRKVHGGILMNAGKKNLSRNAHHLWSAYKDENGGIKVVRSKMEPEEFDNDSIDKEASREVSNAYWGLWGASLVDTDLFSNNISSGIVDRMNVVASKMSRKEASKRLYSWSELRKAFGTDIVNEVRKNVSDGMRIRVVSKYLDVPFIMTADLIDHFGDSNKQELKDIVDLVKSGHVKKAVQEFGEKAEVVDNICKYYSKTGSTKLAVDDNAKRYFEDYYGPFGKELVREIKKRVRADLIDSWMKKAGVNDQAREYWSAYYSNSYDSETVRDMIRKLSPIND